MSSNALFTHQLYLKYLNSRLHDIKCDIDCTKLKEETNLTIQKYDSMIRKSEGVCDELQLMMNKCDKTLEAINALTKD